MGTPSPPAVTHSGVTLGADAELAQLRTTVESLMDAVVITTPDLDGEGPLIETVNPAFCRMTGYAAEELIGRSPRILQGPLTDRAVLDRLREHLAAREVFSGQAVNYRKDGSTYLVEWLIAPVRDAAGRVARWVAVQRDVSELQRMQARELVLLTQLQRRVRNTLGAVRKVARQSGKTSPSVEDYWAHLDGRLAVMARVESHPARELDLQNLLLDEFHSHRVGEDRFTLSGPDVALGPEAAETLALAAHELAANAIKYGAWASDGGTVEVHWRVDRAVKPARVHLQWRETGGPPIEAAGAPGYGAAYLTQHAPRQLNGASQLEMGGSGVAFTLNFALTQADA